jgi:hypothetical protein
VGGQGVINSSLVDASSKLLALKKENTVRKIVVMNKINS